MQGMWVDGGRPQHHRRAIPEVARRATFDHAIHGNMIYQGTLQHDGSTRSSSVPRLEFQLATAFTGTRAIPTPAFRFNNAPAETRTGKRYAGKGVHTPRGKAGCMEGFGCRAIIGRRSGRAETGSAACRPKHVITVQLSAGQDDRRWYNPRSV